MKNIRMFLCLLLSSLLLASMSGMEAKASGDKDPADMEEWLIEQNIEKSFLEVMSELPITYSTREIDDKLIVVLDPGHDSKHAGAQGNGVKEEVINFKIAKYCKEELEKYDGVTVYLTRTTSACPFPKSSDNLDDISRRVKWADSKGADVFISLHCNASSSSSQKGAEVYYGSSSKAGKNLAQKIQNELVSLGLKDRKIKLDDEYRVMKASKKCGFPGIIVEHAFVSNSSDAKKYLKTDSGLKKLGIADATGIAKYYGLVKTGVKQEMPEGEYVFENASVEHQIEVLAKKVEDKTYYIEEKETGKVLTVIDGIVSFELLEGNNPNQIWSFYNGKGNTYFLRSASEMYLDVKEGVLVGNEDRTQGNVRWMVDEIHGALIQKETPKMMDADYDEAAITVTWEPVLKAERYLIYRRVSKGEWMEIGAVEANEELSFVDTGIEKSKTYYYTVKAQRGDFLSKSESTGEKVSTPAVLFLDPELVSVTQLSGQVTVKWEPTEFAKGYRVYRKVSGGSWKRIATIKSSTKLSYTDKKITTGKKYYYRIKAYRGSVYSGYSDSLELRTLKKTYDVKVKNVPEGINVSWDKVSYSQGYLVYRQAKGEEDWTLVKQIDSGDTLNYVDEAVEEGISYSYKVRAFCETGKGYYSTSNAKITFRTYSEYKTTVKLSYRTGPGKSYKSVGRLAAGKVVEVENGYSKLVKGKVWYRIRYKSKSYYMDSTYLEKVEQ